MKREQFEAIAGRVCEAPAGVDRVGFHLTAESSDFIRFNHAAVRQATHVQQAYGTVWVARGQRRATATRALSGDVAADAAALGAERDALAEQLDWIPDDPFLQLPDAVTSTERDDPGRLASSREVVESITGAARGTDLVGFYAGGPVIHAFADSRGQRNWHRVESFNVDWCLYHEADLAVKASHAGREWEPAGFAQRMAAAREQLALLREPRRTLKPGAYRVYFSPVAVAELLGMLTWGAFAMEAIRTGQSSLGPVYRGEAAFDPRIHLAEAPDQGLAARFQSDGTVKPATLPLLAEGRAAGALVSPRSAREYGEAANCGEERPESLVMAAGTLPEADALRALGTGLYISNLHYLNYSDRQACRITGMTRFACLWVEDGRPVAPIHVMRFDDALPRIFGGGLVALTDRAHLTSKNFTYGGRHLSSITAPGAVVDGFVFTL